MGSHGTAELKSILEMLDNCAKGYKHKTSKHYNIITYKGKTYYNFPKGDHGDTNPEIERGHVKKLIRFLEINMDCAKRHLPLLK